MRRAKRLCLLWSSPGLMESSDLNSGKVKRIVPKSMRRPKEEHHRRRDLRGNLNAAIRTRVVPQRRAPFGQRRQTRGLCAKPIGFHGTIRRRSHRTFRLLRHRLLLRPTKSARSVQMRPTCPHYSPQSRTTGAETGIPARCGRCARDRFRTASRRPLIRASASLSALVIP